MRARSKYQVNARLAAPGNKHQANSGERQSKLPAGAGAERFLTGRGTSLNHTEDVGVDREGRDTQEFFVK